MKIITIDRTQRSIRVQTYDRKFRGSLCSLPRKSTKVTPSGVKVNLAEKIIFVILPGRNIHAGTRHYAVLPLSFAVKPLKCAEGARHDLLPCPDCQNDPKSFEIGGKIHVKLTTNYYSVPQYLFSI